MHLCIFFIQWREESRTWCTKIPKHPKYNEDGKKAQTAEQLIICWQQRNCERVHERAGMIASFDLFVFHLVFSFYTYLYIHFSKISSIIIAHKYAIDSLMDTLIIFMYFFYFVPNKKFGLSVCKINVKCVAVHFEMKTDWHTHWLNHTHSRKKACISHRVPSFGCMMFVQSFIIAFYFVSENIKKE